MGQPIDPTTLVRRITGQQSLQLLNKLATQKGMFYRFSLPNNLREAKTYLLQHEGDTCHIFTPDNHLNDTLSLSERGWRIDDEYTDCIATRIQHWATCLQNFVGEAKPCVWMKKIGWMSRQVVGNDTPSADPIASEAAFCPNDVNIALSQVELGLIVGACFSHLRSNQIANLGKLGFKPTHEKLLLAFVQVSQSLRALIEYLERQHDLHLPHDPTETSAAILFQAFECAWDMREQKMYVMTYEDIAGDQSTFKKILTEHNQNLEVNPLQVIQSLLVLINQLIVHPFIKKETSPCH